MYRFVFKEAGDEKWRYTGWSNNIQNVIVKYKPVEFFVQNENRMIVYSS